MDLTIQEGLDPFLGYALPLGKQCREKRVRRRAYLSASGAGGAG